MLQNLVQASVAYHTNLKVVDVEGLHATAFTFNTLNTTNFFTQLEKLSIHIEVAMLNAFIILCSLMLRPINPRSRNS